MTLKMRPRVGIPTGTWIDSPVSTASMPRTQPPELAVGSSDWADVVYGLTDDVKNAAESWDSDGNLDRFSGVYRFHAAHQAVGGTHGNCTHLAVSEQLLNFAGNGNVLTCFVFAGNRQSVIDLGQFAAWEFYVYNRPDDLGDVAYVRFFCGGYHE